MNTFIFVSTVLIYNAINYLKQIKSFSFCKVLFFKNWKASWAIFRTYTNKRAVTHISTITIRINSFWKNLKFLAFEKGSKHLTGQISVTTNWGDHTKIALAAMLAFLLFDELHPPGCQIFQILLTEIGNGSFVNKQLCQIMWRSSFT